jgi:hypothetical protein
MRPNCATTALRPGCRSIPAAKFRYSAELHGMTEAAFPFSEPKPRFRHAGLRKFACR